MMLKAACIFAVIAVACASDVVELGDSDFESRIAEFGLALVKFYAPWCGHCKRMAPEYDTASTILKNEDNPVALVKVDCTEAGKDVCSKYDVKGFPTLKIFRNGQLFQDYNGPREADGIVKFMRARAGPSSTDLVDEAVAEKFLGKEGEASIVAFFKEGDKTAFQEYMKVADKMNEEYRFAHTKNADVKKKYEAESGIVLFRPKRMATKMDESVVKYTGEMEDAAIKTWIQKNFHGLAGHRTTMNTGQFDRPLVTVYYDVDYVKNAKGTNYWRNRVIKVAKKFEGRDVQFCVASAADFEHELSEQNLKYTDKPVVAAKDKREQKFIMSEEFSVENLEKFVNEFLAGDLEPYLKSEDIPEDNSAPVKVVVAKNFEEIVNDPERDVLIEFYAPWCGHCKSLAPKYDELAEKLANDDSVTIAKMDATLNDFNKNLYDVKGFPTIYYAPKNSKNNPKKYEGGREVSDFLKFLAKESTDGLKGYDRKGKKAKKTEL